MTTLLYISERFGCSDCSMKATAALDHSVIPGAKLFPNHRLRSELLKDGWALRRVTVEKSPLPVTLYRCPACALNAAT